MKKSLKLTLGTIGALGAAVLATENIFLAKIISEAKKDYKEELDYLFVLGGLIIGEETPSEHLMKRIEKAAQYLNEHPSTIAITCGGCFRDGQKKSEALIIKEHLVDDFDNTFIEDNFISGIASALMTFENDNYLNSFLGITLSGDIKNSEIQFDISSYALQNHMLQPNCAFL